MEDGILGGGQKRKKETEREIAVGFGCCPQLAYKFDVTTNADGKVQGYAAG